MKKRTSRAVRTSLLGAAGVSAMFVLTGCQEEEVKTHAYEDLESCVAGSVYSDKYCEKTFEMAQKEHEKLAPRYEDVADCETDYGEGQCEPSPQASSSGDDSFFMPLMMGYMMGNMLNNGNSRTYAAPVYRTANGNFRNLSGSKVSSSAFTSKGSLSSARSFSSPSSANKYSKGVSVKTRGGFGSMGRSVGGRVS